MHVFTGKLRGVAIVSALVALVLGFGMGGTANAATTQVVPFGSNGQQIAFIDDFGDIFSVCLSGTNQANRPASHCWTTPFYNNELSGWWWVNTVTIREFASNGVQIESQTTGVPRSSSTNWWCVSDEFGTEGACSG